MRRQIGQECLDTLLRDYYRELGGANVVYEEGVDNVSLTEINAVRRIIGKAKWDIPLIAFGQIPENGCYRIVNRIYDDDHFDRLGINDNERAEILFGMIAHELEHIVVLENGWNLRNIFLYNNHESWVENTLDKRIIRRGLGNYILASKEHSYKHRDPRTISGLSPDKIRGYMQKYPIQAEILLRAQSQM